MADMNPILRNIYEQPAELERVLNDLTGPKLDQLRDIARQMSLAGELVLTSMGSALYSLMPMYEELRERGFRFFEMPPWESTRDGVVYAEKK